MTRSKQLLGAVSAIALVAFSATPALADGTSAGGTITNNVTVNYQVGSVNQTAATASDTFTVDRKVNLTVTEVGSAVTPVSPNQNAAVTTFEVTNLSNDTIDVGLSAAAASGNDFALSNIRIYLDDGDSSFNSASDTEVTYIDELSELTADRTVTIFVVADIPSTATNTQTADVVLTGQARAGGTASSQGAVLTNTTGANTAGVDTVLADTTAGGNTAGDGLHFDTDTYSVSAASLTAAKSSVLISDPVNNTTNPKAIPGAVVEYCIAVSNASGATATSVSVSDTLPADMTYDATFGIFVDGTFDGTAGTCNADGTAGGSFASGTVSGSLSNIAAGVTRTLYFRATIN